MLPALRWLLRRGLLGLLGLQGLLPSTTKSHPRHLESSTECSLQRARIQTSRPALALRPQGSICLWSHPDMPLGCTCVMHHRHRHRHRHRQHALARISIRLQHSGPPLLSGWHRGGGLKGGVGYVPSTPSRCLLDRSTTSPSYYRWHVAARALCSRCMPATQLGSG